MGVTGVSNNITIKSERQDQIEKRDIENALRRNWSLNDRDIMVKVSGHKATLTGTVYSWYQKSEAARLTWSAPGVRTVDNELAIADDLLSIEGLIKKREGSPPVFYTATIEVLSTADGKRLSDPHMITLTEKRTWQQIPTKQR